MNAWELPLSRYIEARRTELFAQNGRMTARDEGYMMWLAELPAQWEREVQQYPRGAIVARSAIVSFARRVGRAEAARAFRFAGNFEQDVLRLTKALTNQPLNKARVRAR